ncbi:hypothetical protein JCM24511_08669 [Saitozyma sp. JCM 24511]|nr:hypothetical protein JCM24511_08669 [Saitozyma sp. JCM 24511]
MATSSAVTGGYTYTLSPTAFAIPILHAARYSSSTVTGVLLGRTPATSSTPSSSKPEVVVEDAVPLLHHYTSLSAMMEVALDLVQEYAGAKGWRVVGYYEAREDGEGMSRQGERVLRALRAEWDGVFGLVQVDNDSLASGSWPYSVYIPPSNAGVALKPQTRPTDSPPDDFSIPPALPARVLNGVRTSGLHRVLYDFDDHLEDSSLAFLDNPRVKEAIAKL